MPWNPKASSSATLRTPQSPEVFTKSQNLHFVKVYIKLRKPVPEPTRTSYKTLNFLKLTITLRGTSHNYPRSINPNVAISIENSY